jgi:tetratricopeptide (TPR) repeat protein
MMDIGTALQNLKKYDEAEQFLRDTLAVARKIYDPGHPTLLVNMNNLSSLLLSMNKLDDADAILTEALQTGRARKLGTMDQPMDTIVLHLSQLRARQKKFDEAVKYAYELHSGVAGKFGEKSVQAFSAVVLVYDNLIQANRGAEGVALVERLGELPAETPPDLRQRLEADAGLLYLAAGDRATARRHADLAIASAPKDSTGNLRITGSLRALINKLSPANTQPASQPTTQSAK